MSVMPHSRRVRGVQQAETHNLHPPRRITRQTGFLCEKQVFRSYRSLNAPLALAICLSPTQYGFDMLFDHQSMVNGAFKTVVLEEIQARAQVLVSLHHQSWRHVVQTQDRTTKIRKHRLLSAAERLTGTIIMIRAFRPTIDY